MLRIFWPSVVLLLAIVLYLRVPKTDKFRLVSYSLQSDPSLIPYSVEFQTQDKHRIADTTAVILNWSRRNNVVKIASSLCSDPLLEDTIALVYVWNNSPNKLSLQDFPLCAEGKLKIYNSPSNLYFQARFLACAEAKTPFCFIQDDDYFVHPEVLYALRSRYSLGSRFGIHLLPPHEALSSQLKRIRVDSKIHTGFAWLGHGAMIQRTQAEAFLSLMHILNASTEELKMADNYYSLLSNTYPQVWIDQGVELGGGQPFTVGQEGNDRNTRHITRATQMLNQIFNCEALPCIEKDHDLPYVSLDNVDPQTVSYTPCVGLPCVLETSISLLNKNLQFEASSATSLFELESKNLKLLNSDEVTTDYLQNPFSHAVDGNPETAFCASEGASMNDYISLDILQQTPSTWDNIELVILLEKKSEEIIMQTLAVEVAHAEGGWLSPSREFHCTDTTVKNPSFNHLRECHIVVEFKEASRFRIQFHKDVPKRFCIHEVWIRGRNRS